MLIEEYKQPIYDDVAEEQEQTNCREDEIIYGDQGESLVVWNYWMLPQQMMNSG